ncbi:MAG TPA: polyribonucleotide nucleotidyltransferase [Flavisolibacter sp.]|nr:polyribonucleotide nucleotidyltransferase [Flavisolibacter sp.]
MLSQKFSKTFDIGDGREITIETGRLARQADGSVTVKMGNSMLLATVVATEEPKPGQEFFPLSVDYMEKFASAGRIPGSFFKREGKLSDYEVLISRLIDRALRPLFPEDYFCEVQVIVTLISSDNEILPDAMACLAASAALAVSTIPIQEIISEVRVSRVDGKFKINPTRSEMERSDMDFIIAATEKNIMMVEGEAKECSEEDLVKALEVAHEAIRIQIRAQQELRDMIGVGPKRDYPKPEVNEVLRQRVDDFARERIAQFSRANLPKAQRKEAYKTIYEELKETLAREGNLPEGEEIDDSTKKLVKNYLADLQYHVVRDMILNEKVRLDGRGLEDVRQLDMEVDILPTPHGAALFTRGETQSLTTVTLGTPLDELLVESAAKSEYSKFILHYNFPPFSTGEVKFLRGPGRREVGHGNLALRSLKQMMPGADYAYTVRVVSDILESNGSSSMATVCAGSLALMDAGVPLPKHVAGVAMGLISKEGKFAVLTDILGDEDHLGDMDFKVTGTREGICGIQMDIKVDGLSMEIMRNALEQARRGRLHILDAMYNCLPAHRADVKPHAPRMVKLFIDREYIGAVIGPGGKIIQEIQRETGTTINIEEKNNQGEVSIFGTDKEKVDRAHNWIKGIVAVPTVGDEYEAIVKSIMPYGAFVEFIPGKQGLLHISEVSWKRLETLEGVLNEGDKIKVKLTGTDPKTGKFKLSRKVLLPKPEGHKEERPREGGPREGGQRERGDRPRFERNQGNGGHRQQAQETGPEQNEQNEQ